MIGQTLSHYRVVSQLGAGGMGVVYKAVDERLNRSVALKVMPPDKSGDPERRARFLLEARSASALNDPHIVTVYDIFHDAGIDVLVMEHVQGRTLKEWIAEGPLDVMRAVDIARQVAEGVGAAHAAGIVHRDLKPGNVMVTERGLVKVLDFGLAKLTTSVDDQATISGPNSVPGSLLGTVEYMSPEQARGDAVDHRSDIFSLSSMLYEMLTGERPFRAAHKIGVLHEILFGTITPPRTRRPEIDGDLEAIVLRGLERDLTLRYQSMAALANDLRRAQRMAGEPAPQAASVAVPPIPVPAGRPAPVTPRPPSRRRQRTTSPSRLLTLPFRLAPFAIAVLFIIPSSRMWLLDHIKAFTSNRPPAAAPAEDTTPYGLTQQGLALLARFDRPGNVDTAIARFERAVVARPDYAPAHAAIARAYVWKADESRDRTWIARAVDTAREAVRLDPYLAESHVALGRALTASGDRRAAEAALRQALVLDPGNGHAWDALGDLAYADDRRDDATGAYTRAAAALPREWMPLAGLGNVAYRSGKYDEAVGWYRRAIAVAPDAANPHQLLGAAEYMRGDFPAAAAALQTAIGIQPSPGAYTNLGTALFSDGRYRESVAAFEKGTDLQPANPLMWGNLGDAHRWTTGGRGRSANAYTRAIQLLDEQLQRDPSNVRDRSRLALYLAKHGDKERALRELASIEDLLNRDVNTTYRAALVHELTGDRDAALRWLQRSLERGYSMRDVASDPELSALRGDVRYQRMATRFGTATNTPPAR